MMTTYGRRYGFRELHKIHFFSIVRPSPATPDVRKQYLKNLCGRSYVMSTPSRIIIALDVTDIDRAIHLVDALSPAVAGFKIGFEFLSSIPVQLAILPATEAADYAFKVRVLLRGIEKLFWDGKFHDIPQTVGSAVKAIAPLRPMMFNIHASASEAAMRKAVENKGDSIALAVTLLTSLDEQDMEKIGLAPYPSDQVMRLAKLAQESGMDGVVCSPQEAAKLREALGPNFLLVTPGIRPVGSDKQDQKRAMTPTEAAKAGVDYMVIGRPITEANDPLAAARAIDQEFSAALGS